MEDGLGVVLLYLACSFGVRFALVQARRTPVRVQFNLIPQARLGFAVRFALGKKGTPGPENYPGEWLEPPERSLGGGV
jgi:hypothetical protein